MYNKTVKKSRYGQKLKGFAEKILGWISSHADITLFALALAVLAFSLLGPGKKVITEVTAPNLVFVHSWEHQEDLLKTIKEEFEAVHPGIKITPEYRPWEELRTLLYDSPGQGAANDANDSSRDSPSNITKTDVIKADVISMDPLWETDLACKEIIEDETYPLLNFFNLLFYNTEILKNAGFSVPPKTRAEFLDQTRACTDPDSGVFGIALALDSANSRGIYRDIYSWIWASGNTLLDQHKPQLRSRVFAETLDFLSLLEKEKILYPNIFSLGEDEKRRVFLEGKTAFMIGSAEDLEYLRQSLGESLGYTAVPAPNNYAGKPVFGGGGWDLAISRSSEHRDEALSFISFLQEQSGRLALNWAIPEETPGSFGPGQQVSGSSADANQQRDPFYSKIKEFYINADSVREFSGQRDEGELEKSFRENLMDLFEGRSGAAGTADAIQKAWEAILDRAP